MTSYRLIGFDPGLEVTGYGVLEVVAGRPRLLDGGVLRIKRAGTLADRLLRLHQSAAQLLDEHKPSSIAIEELFSHYQRPRTAILMGHARGVLLLSAAERNLPVSHYLPTRVKKAMTGNGHATKAQIQKAVQLEFGLTKPILIPDVADALAITLCHFHSIGVTSRIA